MFLLYLFPVVTVNRSMLNKETGIFTAICSGAVWFTVKGPVTTFSQVLVGEYVAIHLDRWSLQVPG